MSSFIPKHGSVEMWVVCEAIGKNHDLIDKMQKNEDGSYTVVFTVGGIELDFNRLCERIDKATQELALEKAKEIVDGKYSDLINELYDIQERIEQQKKELFAYDWEKE